MKNIKPEWRRLDNSAKIFPIATGRKYSTVFRISAVLSEDIDKVILKKAVEKALNRFKSFKVQLKMGFFWYYFEYNDKKIKIEEEADYPCKYIDPKTNNNYVFKVTYYKNKINIDIFHALADGNGGKDFFKEILYTYIELKYSTIFKKEIRVDRKIEYNTEDSYIKNYDRKSPIKTTSKKAYIIKGGKVDFGKVGVIHEIINLKQLQEVCKKRNVTITQYLTSGLIYSIYKGNFKGVKNDKPIKVCIPVDLRKYFQSKTISNFFSYITVELNIEKDNLKKFDDILIFVKKEFEKKLTEKEIMKTMSENVKIGTNIVTKLLPLFIKELLVRLSYMEIRKYSTITFSNIGRVGIIGRYRDYIKYCMILIAPEQVEKIKCSACTFEDKLVFTFTTILDDIAIEKCFFEFLKREGINVEIESNGVLDVIS